MFAQDSYGRAISPRSRQGTKLTLALHKSTGELGEMPYILAQYRAIVMLYRNSLLVGSRSGIDSPENPLYNCISVGLG